MSRTTYRSVETVAAARELAAHLLDASRTHPVLVVTTSAGGDERLLDPEKLADGVGDLAEVAWMPTGDVTWAFSAAMPDEAQVYGDAGRVYPVDLRWVVNPRLSRLHLVSGVRQATPIAEELISEAMAAALAAGLVKQRQVGARKLDVEITGFLPGCAIATVPFGVGIGQIKEALTFPGVPIERVLTKGMRVVGTWNEGDRLIDISASSLPPAEALSPYEVGMVVPARVRSVSDKIGVLELHPSVPVEIRAQSVTGNLLDKLGDLMSVGEIVSVRVEGRGKWILSMLNVDDDELVQPACALFLGGPPWLELPEPERREAAAGAETWNAPAPEVSAGSAVVAIQPPGDPSKTQPRPSPRMLDPRRKGEVAPTHPIVTPVDMDSELSRLRRQNEALRSELRQSNSRLGFLEEAADEHRRQLESVRTERRRTLQELQKLRKAAKRRIGAVDGGSEFADPEQQLRHEIYLEWVRRIPAGEKAARPFDDSYVVGPRFLESLDEVEGVAREKVVSVVMEIVTGIVESSGGRQAHQLRSGRGGDDSPALRQPGEFCWRVSLQQNSPGGRRIHYWKLGARIELSRVVLHDDVQP